MPGYFPLDVSIVRVAGEKAAVFLNGQFTNDIKNLKEGEANYNLFLTQKGKVIADLTVHRVRDDFLLAIPGSFAPRVVDHLSRLAPLSHVTLTDETERFAPFHAIGDTAFLPLLCKEGSGEVEQGAPRDLPPLHPPLQKGGTAFIMNRIGVEGFDCIVPREGEKEFLAALQQNGLSELDSAAQEIIRVENGIALVGVDATEENLPQEANLMRAISLTKGCYLGQEVVARLHYRGHVNRILVGLKIDGNKPSEGDSIFNEDKEVGKITSATFSPTLNAPLTLGYVPYTKKDPGTRFEIGTQRATKAVVVELPVKASPSTP